MTIHVHIDAIVIDADLADRPEAFEQGLREELTRRFAAQGLGAAWAGGGSLANLSVPTLSIGREGALSGERVASALHAALHAPAAGSRQSR
jgi:hypothetical protein